MKRTKLLITATLAVGMTLGSLNVLPARAATSTDAANQTTTQTANNNAPQNLSGEVKVDATSATIMSSYQPGASVVRTLNQGDSLAYKAIISVNGQTWYQVGTNEWINAAGLSQTTKSTATAPSAKVPAKTPAKPVVKKPAPKSVAPKYQSYRTTDYVASSLASASTDFSCL